MTEFAIVLPILCLLLLGIAQLGIAFNNYLTLTDAVRRGARVAAVSRLASNPTQACQDAVIQSAVNLDQSKLGTPQCTSSWAPASDVQVCASYPYSISLIGLVVQSGNLNSCTTERVE